MFAVTITRKNSELKHRLNYDDVTQCNSYQAFSQRELTVILDS